VAAPVRINLTLNVGEQTRRAIAQALKLEHPARTRNGEASRLSVISWLQQQLDHAEAEHMEVFRLARRAEWRAVDFEEAAAQVGDRPPLAICQRWRLSNGYCYNGRGSNSHSGTMAS
jgi:hypothetical protein